MVEQMASEQVQDHNQDAVASVKPKNDVKQSTRKRTVRKEKLENSCVAQSKLPAPPPLPKSPSDSWLYDTLPSLSTKNPSSRTYVGTGISPNNQSFLVKLVAISYSGVSKEKKKIQPKSSSGTGANYFGGGIGSMIMYSGEPFFGGGGCGGGDCDGFVGGC
ncbi:hypothetical protein HAX54_028703 [Datura stramonium]|uniref:Uncharacterized protein n=1 Tax=Datura stramonium TaxID=4076 RepID=A0ABS8S9W7_DATST|nr:hypothetical protein [Datura stramonium]